MREGNERAQQQLREEFIRAQQQRDQAIVDLQANQAAVAAAVAQAAHAVPAAPVPSVPHTTSVSPASNDTDDDASPKKRCLPDLGLLTGQRFDYRVWAINTRRKLRLDSKSIGDSQRQYAYLFARMTVEAQNLVVAFFEQGLDNNTGPDEFLKYLDSIFIDPYAANRALHQVDHMRQKPNEPFSLFLPQFEEVLQETNAVGDPTARENDRREQTGTRRNRREA
ncbi:uncharacterized protein BROUX77_000101 [Berkeleyomyces rouxiae]|uniref:uncharacterized protein n=1 Tax=Berkeleyomyces rouxiae TaxID=2035830 RepID=UPI003B7E34CD